MMLTVWCFLVPILSMVLVGLAVRGVLARGKALDETAWLQVPFLGIAVTVLVLQSLLYLNIPINRGIYALGPIVAALWCVWLWKGRVKESLRNLPVLPVVICAAVLLVQSAGLLRIGPRDYVGRSWSDQFNYVTLAECFRDQGFDVDYDNLGQHPWLVRVPLLKNHRIGQSVLQAYHGVITRLDTRSQFMPTILLSCPLLVLAIFAAATAMGLTRRQAALAGFFAGVVPGMTMLVEESFLSNALGIPFLLLLPTLFSYYNAERSTAALGTTFLCLGALASIYTEFFIFEMLLVAGFLVSATVQKPFSPPHCLGYLAFLLAPWVCNPLFRGMIDIITSPVMTAPVLGHIYPWAYDPVSLGVMWFGDKCLDIEAEDLALVAITVGQVIFTAGVIGLAGLAVAGVARWWRSGRRLTAGSFDLRLALFGIGMIPVLMFIHDREHPYQFFKLLVAASPLHALGMVALTVFLVRAVTILAGSRLFLQRILTGIVWLPVLAGTAIALGATWRIADHTADPGRWIRTNQHIALHPDFPELRRRLEKMHGQDILMRPANSMPGYHQIWAMYFGRRNQIWTSFPYHNDALNLQGDAKLAHLADLSRLPPQFIVLCPANSVFLQPPKSLPAPEMLWESTTYKMWKYDGRPWAFVAHIENPNGCDCFNERSLWIGGEQTVVHLYATGAGAGKLVTNICNGPSLDPEEKLRLVIKNGQGSPVQIEMASGPLVLPVKLQRGDNILSIQILNEKHRAVANDPRPLLAEFRLDDFEFQLGSSSASVPGGFHGN